MTSRTNSAAPYALDYRAGRPRRRVNNDEFCFGRSGFHLPDQRGAHGFPDVKHTMNKLDRPCGARFELARLARRLRNRSGATNQRAPAAGVTQFRVDEYLVTDADNRAVLADLPAQATVRALPLIHHGMQTRNRRA